MTIINVEAHITGSAETRGAVVRQFSVGVVMRGTSASDPPRKPEPKPEPPKEKGSDGNYARQNRSG